MTCKDQLSPNKPATITENSLRETQRSPCKCKMRIIKDWLIKDKEKVITKSLRENKTEVNYNGPMIPDLDILKTKVTLTRTLLKPNEKKQL